MAIVIARCHANRWFLLLLLVSMLKDTESRNCSDDLLNQIVNDGDSAIFSGASNSSAYYWQFNLSSDAFSELYDITNTNGTMYPRYAGIYSVNSTNLTVIKATGYPIANDSNSTAGIYILTYPDTGCTTAAHLITILNGGPVCDCDPTNQLVSCTLSFAESTFQPCYPTMTWTNNVNHADVPDKPTPVRNTYSYTSVSQLPITSDGASRYTCQVTFNAPEPFSFSSLAPNAPTYTAQCSIANCLIKATTSSKTTTAIIKHTTTEQIATTTVPETTTITDSASQNCPNDLSNHIVNEGGTTILNSAIYSSTYSWQVIPSSEPYANAYNITDTGGNVYPKYAGIYSVNSATLNVMKATGYPIVNDSQSTAGMYVLNFEDTGCLAAANIITILNGGPSCSCDPINQLVNCAVTYAESSAQPCNPTLQWTDSDNKNYSPEIPMTVTDTYCYTASSQLPITSDGASEFTCELKFGAPEPFPLNYVAPNAPTYTGLCSIANCLLTTTNTTTAQTSTTAVPTTTSYGKIIQIQPTYGPVAGGTVVTITSSLWDKNAFISAAYIGENLITTNNSKSGQNVLVKTPKIDNEQLINQQLPIILEVSPGPHNISTGWFFTYKPNPAVEDVNPKLLAITGGIHLNITGDSLTAVAQPLVRAVTIIWTVNGTTTYYNESFGPCYPPTENGTRMICVSPPIYIRDDFLHQLFGETDPYSNIFNRKRRHVIDSILWRNRVEHFQQTNTFLTMRSKRSESLSISTNQTYISESEQELMRIYLGILFDGYERYRDDILLDSTGVFKMTNPPIISCNGDIQFDPGKGDDSLITIQGDKMEQCCQRIDYTVRIGDGFCNITSLTDNTLTCSPPKIKPKQTNQDKLFCGESFAIFVDLGIKTYKCSCLSYSGDSTTTFIIIVATTVGSSLLIFVFIITISIIIRKARNSATNSQQLFSDVGRRYSDDNRSVRSTDYNDSVSYKNQIYRDYVDPSTDEAYNSQPVPDHRARPMDQSFRSISVFSNSSEINYLDANEID